MGACPFCFCALWFPSSWFLVSPPPSLPHILQQQLNNELMFDNHCFCFSHTHTHESLSPYTLNDFPVLPWCVHHFCFTLGSNRLNLCFSMTDYFVFSFVLPLKLSGSIQIHELDLFFSLINNYLFWRVRCYLFEFLCLFSRARWRWQLYMMRYNLSLETNMLNSFFLSSCAWHFKPASDQTVLLLLHLHLETC